MAHGERQTECACYLPTTVTRLTSTAPSAIAVLEVVGPKATEIVCQCWRPNQGTAALPLNRVRFGFTRNNEPDSSGSGESIVVCRTSEQRIEIHCHGGSLASAQIVRQLVRHGANEESIATHFKWKVSDETELEAIEDLVKATTLRTTAILLDQMRGALIREFRSIEALIESKQISEAICKLRILHDRCALGCHLVHPWRIVLAGPPNVGKSSLLNLLLGYTRAIVHAQAGTTRDVLSETSSIDGWLVELVDGAGIRDETSDEIEATGIERTLRRIATADCTLLLVDSTLGWTDVHDQILKRINGKVILVRTKIDLTSEYSRENIVQVIETLERFKVDPRISAVVETSSVTAEGLQKMLEVIARVLVPQIPIPGDAIPFRKRHVNWIERTLASDL